MKSWRPPRQSIRLRLAALLTALFVLLGATLLGVSYVLVRSNLTVDPGRLAGTAAERLGIEPESGRRGDPAHRELGERFQSGADGLPRGAPGTDLDHRRFTAQIQEVQEELADDALRELTVQYLSIIAAMAVLSGALGWFVSGRVLRPMSEIAATARRVSRESLHERIALEGPDDELKQLADTFDLMLGRLEAGFDRQATFVSNASHELRTPLSVIRTETDVTLADEADDPEALRRSLTVVREAGQRSERLIDALLILAQADRDDSPRVEVELSLLVRRLIEETGFGDLRLVEDLGPAPVLGDQALLRAIAANLIDNAVRHNSAGGWVEVRTESVGPEALLQISNSGAVITTEDAASLTEPFRRLVTAGTGDGLGLSIAASVAQAHGGQLAVDSLKRGGLRVTVRLPADL